jgi:uncharacterized LabA/DUF88 family protein
MGRGASYEAPAYFRGCRVRTYIYVDGFNFYYGAVRDTPYKWLDFKRLFTLLLKTHNEIHKIKYFTALVQPTPDDPNKPIRQRTYIRALEAHIPEIEVFYGHFLSHKTRAPLANPTARGRCAEVIRTEEKGSDVNLAVHLLNDSWLDLYDCAVVVSNDSDLAESLRLVKAQHKKMIGVITPHKNPQSRQLIKYADFVGRIREGVLRASQLPDPIPNTPIRKPRSW